jgi:hypothetical protein
MQTLKQILFTGWNFIRWLRLIAGVVIAVQGIQLHDAVLGFIGGLFALQALTNTGCCGIGGCAVPARKSPVRDAEDAVFEEVK